MKRTPEQIQKSVLYALIMRELQTRFGGQMLGLFWVVLEPLANVLFIIAFRVIVRERTAGVQIDPAMFLIVAMIPFFAMRNIWLRSVGAATSNLGLFSYRQVRPLDAVIARAAVEMLIYVAMFWVLVILMIWWTHDKPLLPARPLEYMGVVVLMQVWGMGMGLLSSVLAHRRPGVQLFLQISFLPIYMLSGVLIPLASFPATVHEYLLWNPLLHLVELSRWAYFDSYQAFMGTGLSYPLYTGMAVFAVGLLLHFIYRRRLVAR